MQEKYKDKLTLIQIACKDELEDVIEVVKKYGIKSEQLLNETPQKVNVLYGIMSYPTKFVLDPNLKILKKFEGYTQDFFQYIDSLGL